MPGVTLWLSPLANSSAGRKLFADAQAAMRHNADYVAATALEAGDIRAGHVGYPEYPVLYLRSRDFLAGIEGRIRGVSNLTVRRELADLCHVVARGRDIARTAIRDWVVNHDGDYLVFIASRDGRTLTVFSDALGRLPLYMHAGPDNVIIARECKFLLAILGGSDFDRIGCAQYLWFGYPLGERTLFHGVSRAPAGFLLRASTDLRRVSTEINELVTWNLDEKEKTRSVTECASALADTFCHAVEKEFSNRESAPAVLALSGGHDSRTVAAALKRSGISFQAATYCSAGEANESGAASAVAAMLAIPWHPFDLQESDLEDEEKLVWMKDGLNYAGMGFILDFLRRVVQRWGRAAIYVTGDFGDTLLKDRRPVHHPSSMNALIDVLAREHGIIRSEEAEAITGVEVGTLRAELRAHVGAYPEDELLQKAVHFRLFERGRKWYFEGEDRNRFFLQHSSPFSSFLFAREAMRVPDRLKANYSLYREFQRQLEPSLLTIPTPEDAMALISPVFGLKQALFAAARRLPGGLKKRLKHFFRKDEPEPFTPAPKALRHLQEIQAGAGPRRQGLLRADPLRMMIAGATRWQFFNLWTLAVLEKMWLSERPKARLGW